MNRAGIIAIIALRAASAADVVEFKHIERLPAGTAITLMGSTKDVTVAKLAGYKADRDAAFASKTLADLINATALKLTYKVAGLEAREVNGSVTDDQWTVAMDPLPENGSVTLSLEFSGPLSPDLAGDALERLVSGQAFKDALKKAVDDAIAVQTTQMDEAKKREAINQVINKFIDETILPAILDGLPQFLKGTTVSDAQALVSGVLPELSSLNSTPDNAKARMAAVAALQKAVLAKVTSSMTVVASSGVKDFEKYASVDLGVAWIPKIEELRTFVTINVYLGPVEEKPWMKGSFLETLRQTVSLTVGYSFSDISGRNEQTARFRDNNAFLAGIGVRLNKYFRVIGGTALYRHELLTAPDAMTDPNGAARQGKLRTVSFIGGSIDVTALPNLRALFGKTGATPAPTVSVPAPPKPEAAKAETKKGTP